MRDTYTFALICYNCRHKWQIEIPRGEVVKGDVYGHCYHQVSTWLECPHCGATQHGPANDIKANDRLANPRALAEKLKTEV